MEKFYVMDIRTLADPKEVPSAMEDLCEERKEKCLRYLKADDRKRSLGAGLIMNSVLKDFNCQGDVTVKENGKPEVSGVFFNVSHSGDYVIGVASDVPVGCDIEKMAPAPLNVADRFFCSSETDYITSCNDKDFAFWQMWTLKESYVKMTGEGFKLHPGKFCVIAEDNIEVYRENVRQDCVFKHFVYDGHSVAICFKLL